MTRVILLRHGQTPFNSVRRLSGHFDAPLSELGKTQAKYACEYLIENERIDVIVSSDLQRAVNTARAAADFFGLTIQTDTELREIDTGDWDGKYESELDEKYFELRQKIAPHDSDVPFPNGESHKQLNERIKRAFLRTVLENEGKTILFSLHQGAVRAIIRLIKELGADIDTVPNVYNASLHVLSFDGKKWSPEALEIIPYPEKYLVKPGEI